MEEIKTMLGAVALWVVLLAGFAALALEADNVRHTTASCTATSGVALAAGEARLGALFINDGTSTIWLRVGETAVANEGIRLNANGGSYTMAEVYENMDSEVVNCITASATVVLLVVEWYNR